MTGSGNAIANEVPFLSREVEGTIQERFRRVAGMVPDQVAVDANTDQLTYAGLDQLTDQIARVVSRRSDPDEHVPVAVLCDQGHYFMAGVLGALKSSRPVVVFPPDSSPDQLRFLWEDTLHPLVLTNQACAAMVRELVGSEGDLLLIDEIPAMPSVQSSPVGKEPEAADIAMIAYTSGSTGNPKGVMQSHRFLLHTAHQNHHRYKITSSDRHAVLASMGFGAAMTQCLAALLTGATLYLPPVKHVQAGSLIDLLGRERISIIAMPPIGLFQQILEEMEGKHSLPQVRLVLLGGDDLTRQEVERFWKCFPEGATLAFRLAGTETMLIREYQIHPGTRIETEKIPVGYAVPDKEVLLLDEKGSAVPPGEMGEIVVRSPYLASGYWRLPGLTGERFRPDPDGSSLKCYHTGDLARLTPDGLLELLGRRDHMVKVHGFSVHLEMIDMALQRLTFVSESVAVALPLPDGDRRLVAYLVPNSGQKPSVDVIRKELASHLPETMLPSAYVWMEALPHTFTGKVDRKALPSPLRTRPDLQNPLVLPTSDLEKDLVRVWEDILQLEQLGVEDNFFDLGGDSLLSIRMILEAEKILGRNVPPSFFGDPTIAHLALISQLDQPFEPGADHASLASDPMELSGHLNKNLISYRHGFRQFLLGSISFRSVLAGVRRTFFKNTRFELDHAFTGEILRQPYPQGCAILAEAAGRATLTDKRYQKEVHLVRRFVDEQGGGGIDLERLFQASLVGNLLFQIIQGIDPRFPTRSPMDPFRQTPHLFLSSLAQLIADAPLSALQKYFSFSGLEHLRVARKERGGIIIVTAPGSVTRLAMAVLPRNLEIESIPVIGPGEAKMKRSTRPADHRVDASPKSQADGDASRESHRLLEQHKLVQFFGDLNDPRAGHPVIVAGRRYKLRSDFAELACDTGATVIPLFATLRKNAHIRTTILPSFDVLGSSRAEKIDSLLHQVAEFISDGWKTAPESLLWSGMVRHFKQPMA